MPRFNGPDPYTRVNATAVLHEKGNRVRIYVDSDNDAWWRGDSGMWHRFWMHPRDRVERDQESEK